jgi:hypothetical protein
VTTFVRSTYAATHADDVRSRTPESGEDTGLAGRLLNHPGQETGADLRERRPGQVQLPVVLTTLTEAPPPPI